ALACIKTSRTLEKSVPVHVGHGGLKIPRSAEVFRNWEGYMSKRRSVPSYRKHKQSGQAIVTLPDGLGARKDILLGKHGTKQGRKEYARVISEWEAAGRRLPQVLAAKDITVTELIDLYWSHAEQHYRRPDGTPTSELDDFKLSLRPLKHVYGHSPAKDFGPL